jgi:hypothetical protein
VLARFMLNIQPSGEAKAGEIEMEEIVIPTTAEIFNMSSSHCQLERIRLNNEISFARSGESTGGPSNLDKIAAFKAAIQSIEERLEMLTNREAA